MADHNVEHQGGGDDGDRAGRQDRQAGRQQQDRAEHIAAQGDERGAGPADGFPIGGAGENQIEPGSEDDGNAYCGADTLGGGECGHGGITSC